MTWSSDFQERLAGSGSFEPIIILHVMSFAGAPGSEFYASSSPGYGFPEIIGPGLTMTGSSVTPVEWRYTHGTASLQIVTDDIGPLTQYAKRGALCEILIGFSGYDIADFQPVFVGRVNNIVGRQPNYVLDLWDGTSVLNSRLNTGTWASFKEERNNLFYDVNSSTYTTLTSAYGTSDNTLDVTDASKLDKPDGSTKGAVYIDNGTDDPFYLTYTGKSGNQLTGVTTSNVLGTTRVAAATSGTKVYNAAYLEGMPFELFTRIITSASGTTTSYDIYPDSWGYGIPFSLVDISDAYNINYRMIVAAGAGTYTINYGHVESVTDSWEWFSSFFRDIGLIAVQRHGRLTFRPIQDPNDPLIDSGVHISDSDIMELVDWGAYHPDVPAEYQRVRVLYPGASTSTSMRTPETSPMADRVNYDNQDKFFAYAAQNSNEIKARVGVWGPNVPEYVSLRCAGLRLATLAPLDVVLVTSDIIGKGRIDATVTDGYVEQPCMVLRVSPDFYMGQVEITLACIDPL
jgi:hypothetical protein